MTLSEATQLNEEQAREYLEGIRWGAGRTCPHCGSAKSFAMKGATTRAGLYKCSGCRKPFTVTIGTIFEGSHISLRNWVIAFHLMCSSKKGISALQLQRNLGLKQYKSAWFMAHRIRYAMANGIFDGPPLKGVIEADETYVGGKLEGQGRRAAWAKKTPVVSLVERGGKKRSMVMQKVTIKNITEVVKKHVAEGATVHSDEASCYNSLRSQGYQHDTVNHGKKQYVKKSANGKVTTNTVESSFALLKRGVYGTFHHISKQHLHRYLSEFDFRWNMRKDQDGDRVTTGLRQSIGTHLFYYDTKPTAA